MKSVRYIKIQDSPDLARGENGAILNINNSELDAYKKRRSQQNEIQKSMDDINTLKVEMHEIKTTLDAILGVINSKIS